MTTSNKSIFIDFEKYDSENPQIWEAFVHFSFKAIGKGFKRIGARQVFEAIRWETKVQGNDGFKVNNSYTSYYARKFVEKFPQHKDLFVFRQQLTPRIHAKRKES